MLQKIGTLIIANGATRSGQLIIRDWKVTGIKVPTITGTKLTAYAASEEGGTETAVNDGENAAVEIQLTANKWAVWTEDNVQLNVPVLALESDVAEGAQRSIEVWGVPR